jgi:hypothetical protein
LQIFGLKNRRNIRWNPESLVLRDSVSHRPCGCFWFHWMNKN